MRIALRPLLFEETCDALKTGHFGRWPKDLQKQGILTRDKSGWTPMHVVALNGQFDKVPKELLTEENLLKPDDTGWTPLHEAAQNGHLDKWPLPIKPALLKGLLEKEGPLEGQKKSYAWAITEKSEQWIRQELKRQALETLKKSLEAANHPDL
jgi:hypothetical protein